MELSCKIYVLREHRDDQQLNENLQMPKLATENATESMRLHSIVCSHTTVPGCLPGCLPAPLCPEIQPLPFGTINVRLRLYRTHVEHHERRLYHSNLNINKCIAFHSVIVCKVSNDNIVPPPPKLIPFCEETKQWHVTLTHRCWPKLAPHIIQHLICVACRA